MRLHVKLLQLAHRQVDAPAQAVFAHVADDVGELEGEAEFVGIGGGLGLRLAEDLRRHFAHDARHQMAVALQAWEVEVAGLLQVHLAAFNHGLQVARLDAVISGQRHQRFHDGVRGRACVRLVHFGLPPSQLGARHARVVHLVHHIVHLAAKGVEGGDGGAPRFGQKEEGVIKTAARGGGFLLDVLFWGHRVIVNWIPFSTGLRSATRSIPRHWVQDFCTPRHLA